LIAGHKTDEANLSRLGAISFVSDVVGFDMNWGVGLEFINSGIISVQGIGTTVKQWVKEVLHCK
jgi:hypothetical protein